MMRWVRLDTVLALHKRQIAEHGGGEGVRDLGLLESALARPQNLHAYEPETDLASLAAAYAFGIAKNHAFVDGNKRTALVEMRTFLILNGSDINASQEDKYLTILNLADGSLAEADLVQWIRDRIVTQ